ARAGEKLGSDLEIRRLHALRHEVDAFPFRDSHSRRSLLQEQKPSPIRVFFDRPELPSPTRACHRAGRASGATRWGEGTITTAAARTLPPAQQLLHRGAGLAEIQLAGIALLERSHHAPHVLHGARAGFLEQ